MSAEVEARIERWLERAVIGLDLCPFAAPVWKSGKVRVAVSDARTLEAAVQAVLHEASVLLQADAARLSTTLVVVPDALADFEDFLDAVAVAEAALSDAGADGLLQIATFHPDYRFEGEAPDAASNFTNRAPHPVIHLLREAEVEAAIDQHPDPEGIPERNIARLEAMSREEIAALFDAINRG